MEKQDAKKYELGYLLSPLVPTDQVEEKLNQEILSVISKAGGEVVSSQSPKMISLAYPIKKYVGNKKSTFKDAYFGCVNFVASGEAVAELSDALKNSEFLIRTLLIVAPKVAVKKKEARAPEAKKVADEPVASAEDSPVKKDVDQAEIDKEIEGLLAQAQN